MLIDFSACHQIFENDDREESTGLLMSPKPPSNTRGSRRSRQRRRIRGCHSRLFFLKLLVVLLVLPAATTAISSPKWLQSRLRQIAAAHSETPSVPLVQPPPSMPPTSLGQDSKLSSPPLLVVATNEGQVWTIKSSDGSLVAGFSTGPPLLIVDDHYESPTGDDSHPPIPAGLTQSQIVPSMDGMLYWRQPILSPGDDHSSGKDNNSNTKLVPIASIRDLVDNPIQICHEADGENCDILTATSLGPSLFSLNAEGSLNWARARSSNSKAAATTTVKPVPMHRKASSSEEETDDEDSDNDSESTVNSSTSDSKTSLLLQRQDYLVEQISTETGEQVWNITWGSLEALDFMGQGTGANRRHGESFHYLPSGDPAPTSLPSLIFANQGKSLVALWTQPPKFLWKQDFINVVTNVLGIERDTWQAVNVVAESDGMEADHLLHPWTTSPELHPRLPGQGEAKSDQEDLDRWYWWWARGGKKKTKLDIEDRYLLHAQEENGLIFVPNPNKHDLVRDSWYINHLWDSPQARGAQSFQGYLADQAHKEGENNGTPDQQQLEQRKPEIASVSTRKIQNFYDATSMPRLLLLPHTEHSAAELSSPTKAGGLYLSWSVVVAMLTLLAGSVGAAYILYGQKKRKWLSSNDQESSARNSLSAADLASATVSLTLPNSADQNSTLGGSDSNLGLGKPPLSRSSLGKPPRHGLNRSSSAPIVVGDRAAALGSHSGQSLLSSSIQNAKLSPNRRASTPDEAGIAPGSMVKHQSAPVQAPVQAPIALQQGGVGMIDGIPLIRYSRYQSEFRELEPLGRGGFGSVFRVANVLDGREYAVKKVSIRSSDLLEAFSQELHRVLREVKFLALLDHPNIVRYYTAWLEMEENDGAAGVDENTNSKTLSRRFSSDLLTSLDPNFGGNAESQTTQSLLDNGRSPSVSRATLSHLKGRNSTNPLGWNHDFGNFEESSAYYPRHTMPVLPNTEDCGFIFEERSNEEEEESSPAFAGHQATPYQGRSVASSDCSQSESQHSLSSSWDASYSLNRRQKKPPPANNATDEEKKAGAEKGERRNGTSSRHTLYIQMQLCSAKNLADFLANKDARKGPTAARASSPQAVHVDIPWALRHFLQIVQAVHHVHQQGLIHRDLKPSNCFIDETGTVKVGDFGLSRESNDSNEQSESASVVLDGEQDNYDAGDNTVGVGTRSYASPEQMVGSDYDSKTDIYALGIMLFELLYPMYTGMERHICFQKLRTAGTFPDAWHTNVSAPFPTLTELVRSMLCLKPKDRPTADNIARHIQGLLDEHSVTLNISHHDDDNENIIFVRVEAKPVPDVLKSTIQLIHDASAPQSVDIVQYGMRSSTKSTGKASHQKVEKRAILEFALASADVDAMKLSSWASGLVAKLEEHDEILVARHVWHQMAQANWSSRNAMP